MIRLARSAAAPYCVLARTAGRVDHAVLDRVTPLAAPLFLEMGRVPIRGRAEATLVAEAADALLREAGLAR